MEGARTATAADLAAIVPLAAAAVAELAGQRGGAVWRQHLGRPDDPADSLRSDLEASPERAVVVVGTVDGAAVGYGVARLEDLADGTVLSVISDLYVHPDARGIGVGEAMMDLLVAHATDAGAVGIDSLALPGDRETKNFFETFGLKARAIVVHRGLRP